MKSCVPTSVRGVIHRTVHRAGAPHARYGRGRARVGAAARDAIIVMALSAENRASKSSATISALSTPIGCGRRCAFSPSRNRPGGNGFSISQWATCPSACTPASVRPGAMDPNLFAADRLDRVFQRALHGRSVVLDLPAAERAAVIFDDEFVAGHQPSRAGVFSGYRAGNPRPSSAPCPRAAIPESGSRRRRRQSSADRRVLRPARRYFAGSQRRTLMRAGSPSGAASHQAPGNGDNPWICRSTSRAGRLQSIRASAFSILAA